MVLLPYETAPVVEEFTSPEGNDVVIKNLAAEGLVYEFRAEVRNPEGAVVARGSVSPMHDPCWERDDAGEWKYQGYYRYGYAIYDPEREKVFHIYHGSARDMFELLSGYPRLADLRPSQ